MTKPLSVWKYYRNNQKKVIVVLLVTFLSAFLQSALLVFATTMINFYQATTLEPVATMIIIGSSNQSQENRDRLRRSLDQNQAISEVIPFSTKVTSVYGSDVAYIFLLQSKDIKTVMDYLNLTLINGQLPTPGSSDVVLHWKLAANKGLKIGDHFGRKISQSELLMGEYRLVGLLDGKSVIGFSDLECTEQHFTEDDFANLVIIPKKEQIAQAKNYLADLVQQDDKLYTTIAEEVSYNNVNNSIIMFLNIIYLVITVIVTICVSFLFYIYFYQRRPEFGLLEALGHTRQTIIGKAFLEIAGINLLGFIGGVGVATVCEWALSSFILMERGLPLVLWDQSYIFKLLSTPLFVTFSSLLPVWRMLKKVDAISIIEGEV
ncbi:ABC transporter permease [Pelosinus baikalensis]|uniref:Putative hemin transport system permease protein HrtB n=1 Tax=Pelosinus baikalensis TaxID=2892015 RepID=A0ABS8HN57_9FIRM|nr:ABC transporter permease [Pelosinus baikalensis]MCC5464638.1 ABC transporter permease [Pelosinus baikalensis]